MMSNFSTTFLTRTPAIEPVDADDILLVLDKPSGERFVGDAPWLHMDLSGHNCKGGLGAVMSDANGFGVAWGLALLDELKG